jgi:pimeloyl-ACP methyl ester carboxylesterase
VTRAADPVRSATVDRDGLRVHYEVYGTGSPAVLLLMPNTITRARAWKGQVPWLARTHTVVVAYPRGNGGSDPSPSPDRHTDRELLDDAWAVLDAVPAEQAVVVGLCTGAGHAVMMAAERPDRVLGVVAINPGMVLTPPHPFQVRHDFEAELETEEGWAKANRHYWQRDWPGFAGFFLDQLLPEPHSTKQWQDGVAWALGTTPEAMLVEHDSPPGDRHDPARAAAICSRVECPVLVVTGSLDRCQPPERGRRVAELTGGDLVVVEGGGHLPQARDPVLVNLLLRDFLRQVGP